MLSVRQLEILRLLMAQSDDDGKEIVCDGRHCMVGYESISRRSVHALLGHMAIKDAGYASAGVDIYCPTPNR